MTIENQMLNYSEPRLNYDQYMQVQQMYNRPKFVIPPKKKPSIEAPTKVEGSRFDVKG